MADVLIRDVPEAVLIGIDAHASRLGVSRSDYIRRLLAAEATPSATVTVDDLQALSKLIPDLDDDGVMDESWR
jgi:negative regulator of replication initiation